MLELLVGCGGGDKESLLVAGGQTADDAGSGDCGVADRNDILKFSFKDTVRSTLVAYFMLQAQGAVSALAHSFAYL